MTSTLYVDNLIEKTSGNGVHVPGHVIQVVQGVYSSVATVSTAANARSSVLFSATITPKFASSKILLTGHMSGSSDSTAHVFWICLERGSTEIGQGDAAGNRRRAHSGIASTFQNYSEGLDHGTINFLDSPNTTSATTYNVKIAHNSGSAQSYHINRTDNDGSGYDRPRTISCLTLQEIAQ
jgi:hypothetical protein